MAPTSSKQGLRVTKTRTSLRSCGFNPDTQLLDGYITRHVQDMLLLHQQLLHHSNMLPDKHLVVVVGVHYKLGREPQLQNIRFQQHSNECRSSRRDTGKHNEHKCSPQGAASVTPPPAGGVALQLSDGQPEPRRCNVTGRDVITAGH